MKNVLDGKKAWLIVSLLFAAQIINYFDKTVVGLSATPIMQELGLNSAEYGLVASSFFSLYAVSGILVGLTLAHRVRPKVLLAVLVSIWSLSQLPIVFADSLTILIICRVILGIGEGPGNPTAISACHAWFSPRNRNMPTALLMLGSSVGALLAGPVLSAIIVAHGWRAAFLTCSAIGLVWLVFWLVLGADGPDSGLTKFGDNKQAEATVPQRRLWMDPTILASIFVGFTAYWVAGFTVAWVAPMIRTGLGYDATTTGWILSAVSGTSSVLLLVISYLSQGLLNRDVPSGVARGRVNGLCMIGGGAAFLAAAVVADPVIKLALLAIGCALPMLTFTLGPALVSAMVPAAQRARMLTVIYAGVTLSGFVSPVVCGYLIGDGSVSGYNAALVANAVVVLFGGAAGLAFLRPERSASRLGLV